MTDFPDPPITSARLGLGLMRSEMNRSILSALVNGPIGQNELKAWLVLSSGSALHGHLTELRRLGLIEKHRLGGVPRRVEYELTEAGRALVDVMGLAERWLMRHPDRALEPVSPLGWRAFAALADAWESSLIQRLAPCARSEVEIAGAIAGLSDEKLSRELLRLLGAGLLAADSADGADPRYLLTDWGRLAIGLLAAIARWERSHLSDRASPITIHDGMIALVSTLPLVRSSCGAEGICVFTVEVDGAEGSAARSAAVWVSVAEDGVRRCAAGKPPSSPDAWVRGGLDDWFGAVIDARPGCLRLGGEEQLAVGVLQGLHHALYAEELLRESTPAYKWKNSYGTY